MRERPACVRVASVTFDRILAAHAVSPAEYAVLWHVIDTVVVPRAELAHWASRHLPNGVQQDLSEADCADAITSLLARALLIELRDDDIAADLARWRREVRPVSFGVDRTRRPGDVDVTAEGWALYERIAREVYPHRDASPKCGYDDQTPGVIRVFGSTKSEAVGRAQSFVISLSGAPWHWPEGAVVVEEPRVLGAWWHARYELVPEGWEVVLRRA